MASADPTLPSSDSAAAGARPLFSFGLLLAALIGATAWLFALWVGPWIAPAPRVAAPGAVALPDDHDSALETGRPLSAPSEPGIAQTGPVPVPAAPETAALLKPPEEIVPEPVKRRVKVRSGDTLMGVLVRSGVPRDDAYAAIEALREVFDPRSLIAGTELELTFSPAAGRDAAGSAEGGPGPLRALEFAPSIRRNVGVRRPDGGTFDAFEAKAKLAQVQARATGIIASSLYVDATRAGLQPQVVVELIRAMSFDVDFQRDIQTGDGFDVLYEEIRDESGTMVGTGAVLYASLTLSGKAIPIYRFRMDDGIWDYFNPEGKSTRKALMRTPIDGARLSSRFGKRRHPILGYTKMHAGIDFAAPTGTPIMAAGSGVVTEAQWNGGYGRYIRIRHNTTYSTAYAHLSRFARGIRRGVRVQQGQVIGYVGSTGRSTGPHLHYEVHRNNQPVNPLSVKLPTGKTLHGAERARFLAARDEIDAARARLAPVAAAGSRLGDNGKAGAATAEPLGVGGP